ncbi:hypothetical protein INT47_005622 [Mucor saturninus]|uniref:Uncharacterized protein n=1 Tax=Mucor saturninus TaxID=64648 RepID=A0A8H7UUY2_9FUNG|nr:hypothetical protein INT47_005622 [Mucor saturninus]
MEELYDYSQHRYCINIDLGYGIIASRVVAMKKSLSRVERKSFKKEYKTSLLYDNSTRTVIARGNKADEANENSKGLQEGVVYVRNTLSELADIYLKSKQQSFDNTALYALLYEEAMDLLQKVLGCYKQELNSVNMDFCYSLNLPTSWDYKLREDLFLPLFVKAGLLHENDGPGRLAFFSMLELRFQYIQLIKYGKERKIKYGNQRVICTIDYEGTYSVDLKLVSAQYPAFRLANRDTVPQLLEQAHFVIPFGLKELRLSLIACVEKHCYTTLSSESIVDMLEKLKEYMGSYLFGNPSSGLNDRPFPDLKSRWTNDSITLGDIFEHFFGHAEKVFRNEVDKLLYFRELKEIYISAELDKDFSIFEHFDYHDRQIATEQLLDYRMEEFNIHRNPIILPNEEPKSCLKPTIFINIDISSTQIQTVYTYLDKGRQVGQEQIFEYNMRPLNSFIKQSQLYQRPILRISNRLKLGLEKIFGDYLKLYSGYKRSTIKRISVKSASELLGRAFRDMLKRSTLSSDKRVKSNKNRLKRIRNEFVSLNPNIFEELVENIEMDDLFVSKDEFPALDSESSTTCHPGYMYFFMITYLHCLNKQMEEKLESTVGLNWRANNIWYAVSMDKKLLDTVFGTIKKLEKSFFASRILGKDNELRKAKFCTRGEEILPAIQHEYQHLDFRLKSFFVVAQISSKHIQLSLHQVVKLASPGEDPASIIIHDEMIHIDNVYDTLCKSIMKSIQVNCQVDYCTTHKSEEDTQYDFQLFEIYNNIYRNLKPCVVELFEKNKSNLDMNSKIQLNINKKCGCSISIFLRDIIEVGLMSVIENIRLEIIRLESSPSTVPDKYALLHSDTPGNAFEMIFPYMSYAVLSKRVVEYEQSSNNLSIKVSRGCMGNIKDYIDKPYYVTEIIMEPLTLAYI